MCANRKQHLACRGRRALCRLFLQRRRSKCRPSRQLSSLRCGTQTWAAVAAGARAGTTCRNGTGPRPRRTRQGTSATKLRALHLRAASICSICPGSRVAEGRCELAALATTRWAAARAGARWSLSAQSFEKANSNSETSSASRRQNVTGAGANH